MNCPLTGSPCPNKRCIHVTDVADNTSINEMHLCEACGTDYYNKNSPKEAKSPEETKMINPIQELLNLIKSVAMAPMPIQQNIIFKPVVVKSCPTCGYTLENIIKTSRLGCADCYSFFKEEVMPVIIKVQEGSTKHIGKYPKDKTPKGIKIKILEEKLKEAIKEEKYEDAAFIKKELDVLKLE